MTKTRVGVEDFEEKVVKCVLVQSHNPLTRYGVGNQMTVLTDKKSVHLSSI